jgi:putative intracellular protease/amidase
VRRGAGFVAEAAGEGAGGDQGVPGERRHVERLVQSLQRPGSGGGEVGAAPGGRWHGEVDELGLAAVAVGRDHRAPRERGGHLCAVVTADDVEAEVKARRDARAGQHVAFVDEEDVRIHLDRGELGSEGVGVGPVGRRAAPVEQPGVGEGEGAGADRHHAGAVGGGPPQGVEQRRRRGLIGRAITGDYNRVRSLDDADAVLDRDVEPARAAHRAGLDRGEGEVVSGRAEVPEEVRRRGEIEHPDALQNHGHDSVRRHWQDSSGQCHFCHWRDRWAAVIVVGMEQVQILIYDGADELDAIAPFEILAGAGFAVELVSLDPVPAIRAAHGLSLTPSRVLGPAPELLVVPGGSWVSRAPQGAWAEVQRDVMPAAIAERHAAGSVVASVCTGAMLLAASGMLRGRPAVTHRAAIEALAAAGAEVRPDARVVDDGDVLTAGGVTSAIDMALHVIWRERGPEAARAGARRLEHVPGGKVVEVLRAA